LKKLQKGGKSLDFKKFSELIMIEQTLFALPFAFLGVLFAGGGTWKIWVLVAVALAAARTAGMSFNRVIDATIDSDNPRTSTRLIPRGEARRRDVWIIAIASSLTLILVSYLLNSLCFYLSFTAIGMLFTYSYFKRFSASSHFYLGFVEAAAPIGGYLAVTGSFSIIPFVLGFIIMSWIAGLDIIYALQDIEFDKSRDLHSIPVWLGQNRALTASATCYCLSIAAMILAGYLSMMSVPYWIATLCVTCIFIYQQWTARHIELSVAIKNIFRVNMFISPVILCGTMLDVLRINKFI
jgi:4-hydroxybenzoate polyprenyltransferase